MDIGIGASTIATNGETGAENEAARAVNTNGRQQAVLANRILRDRLPVRFNLVPHRPREATSSAHNPVNRPINHHRKDLGRSPQPEVCRRPLRIRFRLKKMCAQAPGLVAGWLSFEEPGP